MNSDNLHAINSQLIADMKDLAKVKSELESLKLQILKVQLKLMERETVPLKKKNQQASPPQKPNKELTNTISSLWNWDAQ
jgi:hypothetical protein